MKPLTTTNPHLRTMSDRKQGVERNVRSSSALEGVSAATFRRAISVESISKDADGNAPRVKVRTKQN